MSVETLRWQGIEQLPGSKKARAEVGALYTGILDDLRRYSDACTYFTGREELITT
jgi:hypothetical protein